MDFTDSPEEAAFRAELRSFLDGVATRRAPGEQTRLPMFSEHEDDASSVAEQQQWQRILYDGGWGCVTWPKEYGGRDATPMQALIFREELTRYQIPSLDVYMVGLGMVGPTIIAHGTEEQRRRFIPALAEGSEIWCQLWSEPNAGSDLAALETRAVREEGSGEWTLRGQKVWTTAAHHARWGLCLTRTDPDLPKHKGLSVFAVDMTAPGVTVRPLRQITGGAEFTEVFFDDARIPADALVGEVNDGWRVAMTTLMNERYAVGTHADAMALVTPLLALARDARLGEGRAYDSPTIRQELAEALIRAKLLTLTAHRSLTKASKGGMPGPEGSILKLVRTHLQCDVGDIGARILGPAGLLSGPSAPEEGLWSLASVGMIGTRIGGGTDEIMLNIIGERVLGLPKEPQLDAGIPFRELRGRLSAV